MDEWEAEGLRRTRLSARRMYLGLAGALLLVGAGVVFVLREPAEPEERDLVTEEERVVFAAGVRTAIDEAEACAAAWSAATAPAALAALQPGEPACPILLEAPTDAEARRYIEKRDAGWMRWSVYKAHGVRPPEESACKLLERHADKGRHLLGEPVLTRREVEAYGEWPALLGPSVLLVVEGARVPKAGDPRSASFGAGGVSGRAYVWSPTDLRFVCTGPVLATSSPMVSGPAPTPDAYVPGREGIGNLGIDLALERDLEVQERRAIVEGIRAVAEGG